MAKSILSSPAFGIAFCALGALCEGIDLQVAGVAAGGIAAAYHPSAGLMGSFFSASTLGLLIGAMLGGRISDNVGRRGVLIFSVATFGLFSVLTAFAWDMSSLILSRLLTGLGLGGALPMLLAYVSERSPPRWYRANVTLVYAMMPLGGALISLTSLMLAPAQWRALFVLGGVLPLILAPLMLWGLPESPAFQDARRAANLPRRGSVVALFADGRAMRTTLLWCSFFFQLLLLYLLLNWLPTLLVAHGATRAQAAIAQIGFNLGGVPAAALMGLSLQGKLRGPSILVVFVAIPVLLIALANARVDPPTLTGMVLLLGCAVVAAQAYLYASVPGIYPVTIRGIGSGAAVAMGRSGAVVGPLLGGFLQGAGHDTPRLLMDLLPLVIMGSVSAVWFAWISRHEDRSLA